MILRRAAAVWIAFTLIAAFCTTAVLAGTAPEHTVSAEAFIQHINATYHVTLEDPHGYLSGRDGAFHIGELDRALTLFSPAFLQSLVARYARYGARFTIRLEPPSQTDAASIEWDRDLLIVLHYDRNPALNGITAGVLAHELGHAIHYLAEENGSWDIQSDLEAINAPHQYAGSRYARTWRSDGGLNMFFAYSYGLFNHYEDIATIFELLVDDPEGMRARLADPRNAALRRKTEYIRDMAFYHISDACFAVFAPLDEVRRAPAVRTVSGILTPSRVLVNGTPVPVEMYLIDGSNFIKLRDMAMLLWGTSKGFEVGFNERTRAVTLYSGQTYTPVGGELTRGGAAAVSGQTSLSVIYLDGRAQDVTAYLIGGNNYLRLRDLCLVLGVMVEYIEETRDILLTTGS
jgi:hypothetical protein